MDLASLIVGLTLASASHIETDILALKAVSPAPTPLPYYLVEDDEGGGDDGGDDGADAADDGDDDAADDGDDDAADDADDADDASDDAEEESEEAEADTEEDEETTETELTEEESVEITEEFVIDETFVYEVIDFITTLASYDIITPGDVLVDVAGYKANKKDKGSKTDPITALLYSAFGAAKDANLNDAASLFGATFGKVITGEAKVAADKKSMMVSVKRSKDSHQFKVANDSGRITVKSAPTSRDHTAFEAMDAVLAFLAQAQAIGSDGDLHVRTKDPKLAAYVSYFGALATKAKIADKSGALAIKKVSVVPETGVDAASVKAAMSEIVKDKKLDKEFLLRAKGFARVK